MTYWLDVFTPKSWIEFIKAGAKTSGFPDGRWKTVQNVRVGDILVCYMRDKSCWFAALEVTSEPYQDYKNRIWSDDLYPSRISVKPLITIDPDKAISARQMLQKLKIFEKVRDSRNWGLVLRISPRKLIDEDGNIIISELKKLSGEIPITEETPDEKVQQSYHDRIREMLYEIGQIERKVSEKEYRIDGERIDVAWKRIETGNPYAVFEVQVGGNFYEALAKLKHAWDKWNSRPFLVTTEQYKERALVWVKGSFHEIQGEIRIVDCERVKELYEAIKKTKSIKEELGIS